MSPTKRQFLRQTGTAALGSTLLASIATTRQVDTDSGLDMDTRVSPVVTTHTYAYADSDSDIIDTVSTDEAGYIVDGPVNHDGVTYWLVDYNNSPRGWTSATNIELQPASEDPDEPDDPGGISPGTTVSPIVDTHTYAYADSDSDIVDTVMVSESGEVVDGPVSDGSNPFWLVEYATSPRGWTPAANIEPGSGGGGGGIIEGVPYYNQYLDNDLDPGGSCQNTAIAMVLNYYGWGGVPDDITADYGSGRAQTPAGGATVFNSYGRDVGVTATGSRSYVKADIEHFVDQGVPVIVYGWFTPSGHVMVVLGHDDQYYYCNDSGGEWNERYKGDFYNYQGDGVAYRKDAFLSAAAPDGYIWALVPE